MDGYWQGFGFCDDRTLFEGEHCWGEAGSIWQSGQEHLCQQACKPVSRVLNRLFGGVVQAHSEWRNRGSTHRRRGSTALKQAAKPSGPPPVPIHNIIRSGKHAGRTRILKVFAEPLGSKRCLPTRETSWRVSVMEHLIKKWGSRL